jgi:hypothetical protein
VSGKALAAGIGANPKPVASAIPLTYFSNDAYLGRANWITGLDDYPTAANWKKYGEQLGEVFYRYFERD